MENVVEKILREYPLIILDGGTGSELLRRGAVVNDPLWSSRALIDHPEIIEDVHYDYFMAGADCAITVSYQAYVRGFIEKGFSREEALDYIRRSAELAIKAKNRFLNDYPLGKERPEPFVVGSAGSYAAVLGPQFGTAGAYVNAVTEEIKDYHRDRIQALLEGGVDLIAFETLMSLKEGLAVAELMKEFPEVYYWICFRGENGTGIVDGNTIEECLTELSGYEQLAAVGVNCTKPMYIDELLGRMTGATDKPIVIYPNSGERYYPKTKTWGGKYKPCDFAEDTKRWHAAGARLIGGCCRTTPDDIAKIASWARKYEHFN